MKLSLEDAVRGNLAAFLTQEVTIGKFKSWLVAATWNRQEDTASSGTRFANEINLALAEHSGGYRSDAELRDILTALANRSPVETR